MSPSCERNKAPLLGVLRGLIPSGSSVFEVGSLTGQHAAYFSRNLDVQWQPSDVAPETQSIEAWAAFEGSTNVKPPITFDLFDEFPTVEPVDALVCINTIHIAPWPATRRLFEFGLKALVPNGKIILYGPYRFKGVPLEPSNQKFDQWLHERYEGGGIRTFEDIQDIAIELGYTWGDDTPMPSKNHVIWWHT